MTEDGYYAGEFTDAELNCRADIADYQRAVEEFFFEQDGSKAKSVFEARKAASACGVGHTNARV
jgi:hypothetical protein